MSATGVAGNSGRTGMRRSIRVEMVLLLGAAFGLVALAPSRASDDGERGCVYRLSVYVKTADAMLQSNHPMILSSLESYAALSKGAWFEGCTLEEVKAAISKSKFALPAHRYNRDIWLFALSNKRVQIGFSYLAGRRKSECHYQVWSKDIVAGEKVRGCPDVSEEKGRPPFS